MPKILKPGDAGYVAIPKNMAMPVPPKNEYEKKNIFSKGLTQVGQGLEEGILGLAKGASEFGVATGTIFDQEGLRKKSEDLVGYFNRQIEAPHLQQGRQVMQGWSRPVEKSLRLLGNAGPSIGAAYGGGILGAKFGKARGYSPKLTGFLGSVGASIPLGTSIAGSYWAEGVEAGKDPKDVGHYATAITDGVVQSVLEALPFMGWMKGGKLGTRVARGFLQEGGEEVVQGLFENALKVVGWKGAENLYEDMVGGLAESFVAGALSGGLMGTVPQMSLTREDMMHDLTKKLTDDTFKKVSEQGIPNKDGSPMTRTQVEAAARILVNKVDKFDEMIYPKLKERLTKTLKEKPTGVVSGPHEAVERTKIEDGQIVTTKDEDYARAPLDTELEAETKRKNFILKIWKDLDYKIFGRSIEWSKLPEIIRYNIFNNPDLNVNTMTTEDLKSVLDQELDKPIVHVTGREHYTNPKATVFFGPLRNMEQDWTSGREKTKEKPEIHGDIWIQDLPRKINDLGIHPHDIEFVGKGSKQAMKTFLSEYKGLYGTEKVAPVTSARYKKSKISKASDKAADALDKVEKSQMKGTEKERAYGTQQQYVDKVHAVVREAWKSIQSISAGEGVLEATNMLNWLIKGKPIKAKGLQIKSIQDIAEIFSVFRNPKLEISQAVYVRDGEIVDHEALTTGSPADVLLMTNDIRAKASRMKAQYYLLHNHPSGDIKASALDLEAHTNFLADSAYLGHIILDHKQFNFIDTKGREIPTRYKSPKTFFHKGKKEIIDLGSIALSNFKEGMVTLFLTDGKYLQSVHYIDPKQEDIATQIGVKMVENLSPFYFLGVEGNVAFDVLPEGGIGVVQKTGKTKMKFDAIPKEQMTKPVWKLPGAGNYVRAILGETTMVGEDAVKVAAPSPKYYATRKEAQDYIDMNKGLNPDLTFKINQTSAGFQVVTEDKVSQLLNELDADRMEAVEPDKLQKFFEKGGKITGPSGGASYESKMFAAMKRVAGETTGEPTRTVEELKEEREAMVKDRPVPGLVSTEELDKIIRDQLRVQKIDQELKAIRFQMDEAANDKAYQKYLKEKGGKDSLRDARLAEVQKLMAERQALAPMDMAADKGQIVFNDATGKAIAFVSGDAIVVDNMNTLERELRDNLTKLRNLMDKVEGVDNVVEEGMLKYVRRFGGGEVLGWLLKDQIGMRQFTQGGILINSFSMVDMLNELYEAGGISKNLAQDIHKKLETILKTEQKREATGFKVFPTAVQQAGMVEEIRSLLYHLSQYRDITSRPIIESQAKGELREDQGATIREKASSTKFDSYNVLRNLLEYYSALTGLTDQEITAKFKLKETLGGVGYSSQSKDVLVNMTRAKLPVKARIPLTKKEEREGVERGYEVIETGGVKFLITREGFGKNPWFGSGSFQGEYIGIIPNLKRMLKDERTTASERAGMKEKLAELEEVVRWIEKGTPKDMKLSKQEQQDAEQKRYKGIRTLLKEFKMEQKEALDKFLAEAEGVYYHKGHAVWDIKDKMYSFVQPGAYYLVKDPLDPGRALLTQDGVNGPTILMSSLLHEWEEVTHEKGVPLKEKKFLRKRLAKSVDIFTSKEEVTDIMGKKRRVRGTKPKLTRWQQHIRDKAKMSDSERKQFEFDEKIKEMQRKADAAVNTKERKEFVEKKKRLAEQKEAERAAWKKLSEPTEFELLGEEEETKSPVEALMDANPDMTMEEAQDLIESGKGPEETAPEVEIKEGEVKNSDFEFMSDEEVDEVGAPAPDIEVFDGRTIDTEDEQHISEPARYESRKLRMYKKVVNFFTGNEEQTLKFLGDWVKGGEDAIRKMENQISDAPKEVMDEVVKTAVKDKNYIKLAQLKGFQIQDLIRQEVRKEMLRMYPGASEETIVRKGLQWLKYMNDAGEEILHIPGNTLQYTYSDKGIGGPWEQGLNKMDGERDANVERLTAFYRLSRGVNPPDSLVRTWRKIRPTAAYFNLLTPALQRIILWNKSYVEDPIFFTATTDVLTRADNVDNRRAGYSPRMFTDELDSEKQFGGVPQSIGSQRVSPRKYRTFAEFAKETRGGVVPVDNYAASAGWYTKEYLIRINQAKIIEQFKGIRNPGEYDIGIITYTSDTEVERVAKEKNMTSEEFLKSQGYDEVKNAEGLTRHWRGEFFRPWVHRSAKHAIERFYVQPAQRVPVLQAINELSGFAKRMIMMMPHMFALQITSSSWLWSANKQGDFDLKSVWDYGIEPMFNPFKIAKGMKLGVERQTQPFKHIDGEYDHEKLELFIKHGLRATSQNWMKKALYDSKEYAKHPMDWNKRDKLADFITGKGGLDNYIFDQYMSKAIYRYAESMFARFKKQNPNMSDEELAEMTVKFVNDTSGTLPSYTYGAEGPWLQFLLFARDFTMNFHRQVTGAAYNIPQLRRFYKVRKGAGTILNPWMHADATTKQMEFLSPWYAKHLGRTLAIKIAFYGMLQAAAWEAFKHLSGDEPDEKDKWIWNNEPGKKAMIRLPMLSPDDHPYYLDPIIWREVSQGLALLPEVAGGKGPLQVFKDKMSYSVRALFDTWSNEDYLGQPIRDPGANVFVQSAQMAAYYADGIWPSAFQAQPKELGDLKTTFGKVSRVLQATGMPMKRGRLAEGEDFYEMRDLRRREASMMFRRGSTRRDMINASYDQLLDMVASGKISKEQYKNEMLRRRFASGYFYKRKYKGLVRDELMDELMNY